MNQEKTKEPMYVVFHVTNLGDETRDLYVKTSQDPRLNPVERSAVQSAEKHDFGISMGYTQVEYCTTANPNLGSLKEPLGTAALKRLIANRQLRFLYAIRQGKRDELKYVLTVQKFTHDSIACQDSTRDKNQLVWLPLALGGKKANGYTWYRTENGIQLESASVILRYELLEEKQ